jgi:hypothetical protein
MLLASQLIDYSPTSVLVWGHVLFACALRPAAVCGWVWGIHSKIRKKTLQRPHTHTHTHTHSSTAKRFGI